MNATHARWWPLLLGLFALVVGGWPAAALHAQSSRFTVSGYVKDADTGEELIGATVVANTDPVSGVNTNDYGFYSLRLPPGRYEITVRSLGYAPLRQAVDLTQGDVQLNLRLSPEGKQLDAVVIEGEKADRNVQDVQMSLSRIDVEQVRKLPTLFGEPDLIRAVQLQPGVLQAGEGTSGFFVRGGGADQNLILIDEAPVYDVSHLFGLFSVFNSDALKSSDLYKGGIPAQYGGRLSSILDVRTKDGNDQRWGGSGTIGLLASKLFIEGPIAKEKASVMVSARRSYVDVFNFLLDEPARNNRVHFYDLNFKVSYKPTNKDRFFLAAYLGRDRFRFGRDAQFSWGNATTTFRWNHVFNSRLFSNTTLLFTNFDYLLEASQGTTSFKWTADMQEYTLKQDFGYYLNPSNTLTFGLQATRRQFSPGIVRPGSGSIFAKFELQRLYAMDYAAYVGNDQKLGRRVALQYGLRFTAFQNMGPGEVVEYARTPEGQPDNVNIERLNVRKYGDWQAIKTYVNVEPRASIRVIVDEHSSVKASYNRMVQYIHLLNNSTVPIPFNTWTPSSQYLRPQVADQVAAGYFRNFGSNRWEFSAELYYKWIRDVTDFADNAQLLLNRDVAVQYRQGTGTGYGAEFQLARREGKLSGFVSYTLSWATRQVDGVNLGREYFANYDRRHSLNVVATYDLSKVWNFGATFTYATGRPITLAQGRYSFDGYNVDYYTERNAYRLPDFHRLDLAATYSPKKNAIRRWKQDYVFSVYNAYGRQNVFTYYTRIKQDDKGNLIGDGQEKEVRKLWLFSVLPSFAWTIRF
jgi:hypothetical protein